jgi:hypothetical protein
LRTSATFFCESARAPREQFHAPGYRLVIGALLAAAAHGGAAFQSRAETPSPHATGADADGPFLAEVSPASYSFPCEYDAPTEVDLPACGEGVR